MTYTNDEKQVAKDFIDCKIPEYIYDYNNKFNKEHNLNVDTMEYYEALFDFAHCILDDINLVSNFSIVLKNKEFLFLIKQQDKTFIEQNFCDKASMLLKVIEKYIEI